MILIAYIFGLASLCFLLIGMALLIIDTLEGDRL